jgi:hypothetical protein
LSRSSTCPLDEVDPEVEELGEDDNDKVKDDQVGRKRSKN